MLRTIRRCCKTPSLDFPMGTDSLGRDTLSRVIAGTQLSLIVSVSAVTTLQIDRLYLGHRERLRRRQI